MSRRRINERLNGVRDDATKAEAAAAVAETSGTLVSLMVTYSC